MTTLLILALLLIASLAAIAVLVLIGKQTEWLDR